MIDAVRDLSAFNRKFAGLTTVLICMGLLASMPAAAQALAFGDGDSVRVEDSPSLDITGDITLEAWIYRTGTGEEWNIILSKPWTSDSNPWHVYRLGLTGSGAVPRYVHFTLALGGANWALSSRTSIPLYRWTHIAGTYDGSSMRLYIDGTLEAEMAASGAISSNDQPVIIGSNLLNSWNDWFGSIDEVRIWNVARTAEEIRDAMNVRLTGSEAGLAGYWRLDEGANSTAEDGSGNGNTGTLNGSPVWVEGASLCTPAPAGMVAWWGGDNNARDLSGANGGTAMGASGYADGKVRDAFSLGGSGDWINVGNDPCITGLTPAALTIEAWVYNTAAITTPSFPDYDMRAIVGQRSSGTNDGYGLEYGYVEGASASGYLVTLYFTHGRQAIIDYEILPDRWTHIAGVFDASAGTIYVDGVAVPTVDSSAGFTASTDDVMIGRSGNFGPEYKYHVGRIDEVAVFDRALSAEEIAAVYDAGPDGMCRPCAADPSGLISWWRGEDNAMDSVGANNGAMGNGAAFASGRVDTCFLYDGIDDYTALGTWFDLQSFSIEMWVNPGTTQMQYADIIDNNHTGSRSWVLQQNDTVTNEYYWGSGDGAAEDRYFTLTAEKWTHLTITRDGSTRVNTVYIDGVALPETAGTRDIAYDGSENLSLARHPVYGRYWNGLMDEVAIYDRALTPTEVQERYNAATTGGCCSCAAQAPDKISWWRAEGDAVDCIGGNGGTLTNGAFFASGYGGAAFSFDGSDDYVLVADPVPASLQIQDEATLEAWVYAPQYPGGSALMLLMGSQYDSTSSGITLFLDGRTDPNGYGGVPAGHILLQMGDGVWHFAHCQSQLPLNQWVHVAATWKANEAAEIYYNGVLQPVVGSTWDGSVTYDGAWFAIGQQKNVNRPFLGKIDEPAIYDRALTAEEIAAIAHAGREGTCFACAPASGLPAITATDLDPCAAGGVSVQWTDPAQWGDDRISGRQYEVLRDGVPVQTGIAYGTFEFTDTTGDPNTAYTYTVRYVNGCGSTADTAGAVEMDAADGTPPDTAGWTSLTAAGDATVDLSWGETGLPDTVGYNVYRDTVPDSAWGAGQKVNGTLVTGTTYPDTPPAGDLFFYQIKAVDACGNEAR